MTEILSYPLERAKVTTQIVPIGNIRIGGDNPVCIQSMLVNPCSHTQDACAEIHALVQAGCQMIRMSMPTQKELDAVPLIRHYMKQEGLNVPLVADIHFSSTLAINAASLFEKVRINPGNFTDTSKNRKQQAISFDEGKARLQEELALLVVALKKHNTALRIGVNHGSLSERMIQKYGDSPIGMVESALEAIEILEENTFYHTIISLKSSNSMIVQKAYRLLWEKQRHRTRVYPLHLGVTEAGNKISGEIKGLSGIAPLLLDGLGDTIRVSLTGASLDEIPVAYTFRDTFASRQGTSNPVEWKRSLHFIRTREEACFFGDINLENQFLVGTSQDMIVQGESISDFIYKQTDTHLIWQGNRYLIKALTDATIAQDEEVLLCYFPSALYQLRSFYYKQQAKAPVGLVITSDMSLLEQGELAAILSERLIDFILLPANLTLPMIERIQCLLQATGLKRYVADYIACPSCARTLYDIEATTQKIQDKTKHLKDVKIGIMGCIVNGPGEMADAEFGYVGAAPNKIDLYYLGQCIQKGIPEEQAVERLVSLIKEKGKWVEKI